MRNILSLVLICTTFLQLISCGSDPTDVEMHVHDATIKIRVYQETGNGNGTVTQVPISGATIELYTTESDREMSAHMVNERNSDSSGNAIFTGLKENYYYLRCLQPSYGEKLDGVSTPDGTISFVDFVY